MNEETLKRWRLILGKAADPQSGIPLEAEQVGVDQVLEALYESDRQAGLGSSAPNINRWLGDIRRYFPSSIVQVMQKDALERLGLRQMLLEPELLESIEADVHLVGTILSLNKVLPEKTRETARLVVRRLVQQLEDRLRNPLQEAVNGSLRRSGRNRHPRLNEIDWTRTIRANLKHYQPELQTIIPEQLIGFGKKRRQLKHIILLVDQSGSMAGSVVYSGIIGSILASMNAVRTNLIVFDTSVVDLTEHLHDPVDLLFATQLGGGTHITKAVTYARQLVQNPADTIFFLISDLMEGLSESELIRNVASLQASGVRFISLLALNDKGAPAYDRSVAEKFARLDIPAFACTPDQFPDLLAHTLQGKPVDDWINKEGIVRR